MAEIQNRKADLLNRLSRLEGQVKGVRKMIQEEKSCEEIVVQLSAIHAAMENATKIAITSFFEKCLEESEAKGEDRCAVFEQLAGLLLKARL
jgi:DNA-binding FrmR family transcriptional regulator